MSALPSFVLCPAGTLSTASSRLRCHVLARELARLGCAVRVGIDEAGDGGPLPDVLLVQKCSSPAIVALARQVRAQGGQVLFDIDDWGDAVPWAKAEPQRLAEILALATVVTVDTDTRVEVFARDPAYAAVPAIWVVPDPVDYLDAAQPPAAAPTDAQRLLAGCWFGNGPNLPPSLPWVQAALASGRLRRFGVITNAQFVPQMQAAWPVLAVEAWALESFPERLRAHDFCLLIHDTNLEGVQKSNNKMLAALGQGVVPLVSRTPAYAELAQRIGIPELVVDSPADVAARLAPGVLDALRERILGPACQAALDAYLPATVARGLLARLQPLRAVGAAPALATPTTPVDRGPVLLHREGALMVTESVRDGLTQRDLWFGQPPRFRQSSFCVERPLWLVTEYTRQLMAALLLDDAPRRVLALGAGGAAVPRALKALFGDAVAVDLVDIDLAVFRAAHRWFGLNELSQYRLFHHDARDFVQQATEHYDLIVLDVWDDQGVPDWLLDPALWRQLRRLSGDTGVLACNAPLRLADALCARAADAYAGVRRLCRTNVTVLAGPEAAHRAAGLQQRCARQAPALAAMGVPLADYARELASASVETAAAVAPAPRAAQALAA